MKLMSDKVFLDSNILIYAYSIDEPLKRDAVTHILERHETIIISTQTINEFINVMSKKKKLSYAQIMQCIHEFFSTFTVEQIYPATIIKAIDIAGTLKYSYFDSLIIASALITKCTILYTEDMHHQHNIEDSIKIINPFKTI